MGTEPDPKALADLEKRIEAAKQGKETGHRHESHQSQASAAWRMVIELVTGLGMGFGIGYGLDALLDTRPWLMILFTLLGFAAGIRVMMQSANELQKQNMRAEARKDTARDRAQD